MVSNQGQFCPTENIFDCYDCGDATGITWTKDAIKHPTTHRTSSTTVIQTKTSTVLRMRTPVLLNSTIHLLLAKYLRYNSYSLLPPIFLIFLPLLCSLSWPYTPTDVHHPPRQRYFSFFWISMNLIIFDPLQYVYMLYMSDSSQSIVLHCVYQTSNQNHQPSVWNLIYGVTTSIHKYNSLLLPCPSEIKFTDLTCFS